MYEKILERAKLHLENHDDLELVEIIESSIAGTPRKKGAFMFVDISGLSFGTIGGGKVEYLATEYAKELLLKKENGERNYNLSQNAAANIGMVCGGECKMKFTYLTSDVKSKHLINELISANRNKNIVYIFGAGHISEELAKLLKYTGFDYVVWDDREDFANRERFLDANEVICKSFENILDEIEITSSDMIVIMTRGHASDYEVEKQILKSKAYYIGVIGSKNKNKVLREKLIEDGFSEEMLNKVHAPIGFNIGAETVEEITISIIAELIYNRSKMEKRSKLDYC